MASASDTALSKALAYASLLARVRRGKISSVAQWGSDEKVIYYKGVSTNAEYAAAADLCKRYITTAFLAPITALWAGASGEAMRDAIAALPFTPVTVEESDAATQAAIAAVEARKG